MKEIRDFFIYRNAIHAKSIIKFFKEGSSMPVVVTDDLGRKYFVKLSATGEGVHALAAEYIAVKLASLTGIPILEPLFITINKNTNVILKKRNEEVEELTKNSSGINIGFPFLENAREFSEKYDGKYISDDLRKLIFLYDCFLLNIDRKASNTNLLLSGNNIYVTDFGASFLFKEIFNGIKYEKGDNILVQLKKHIFYSDQTDTDIFRNKIDRLPEGILDEIINELPAQWVSNSEKVLLKQNLKEKLNDKNYPGKLLSRIVMLESESDEVIRQKQKKKLLEFKKKFNIR